MPCSPKKTSYLSIMLPRGRNRKYLLPLWSIGRTGLSQRGANRTSGKNLRHAARLEDLLLTGPICGPAKGSAGQDQGIYPTADTFEYNACWSILSSFECSWQGRVPQKVLGHFMECSTGPVSDWLTSSTKGKRVCWKALPAPIEGNVLSLFGDV